MQLQALNIPPPHGSDQSRYLGTDSVLFLLPRIKDGASLYNSKSLQEETIRHYQEERTCVTFQCLRSHFWTTHRLSKPDSLEGRCVCAAMLQGTWNEFPCSCLLSEHVRTLQLSCSILVLNSFGCDIMVATSNQFFQHDVFS